MNEKQDGNNELLSLTAEIVASHVSNNAVPLNDIPYLIKQVHACLRSLGDGNNETIEKPRPAVPIRKSITPEHIICLEDGKKLKMLKRHLKTAYDMTPEQYREKWDLPPEYPMVAPRYAEQRRKLAKKIGLGKNRRSQT